ncbi:hypothetical protein [Azospirillum palustre]|uniref:hypothetical protein n=1 Tax=Azospirillum palustre TaxID=2044885 RepID=UPI00137B1760|nr:hypothetical protein [Azospirillum palustre]
MLDKSPSERATRQTIIPAAGGWAVVCGIYLNDDVPVLAWNFDEDRPRPVTVYGLESRPVILRHGGTVYHPDGQRESWDEYVRRATRSSSNPQRGAASCPRR